MSKDSPRTSVLRDNELIQKGQDDLIRRGDAKDAAWEADSLELSTHGAGKIEARINAIPAAQPTVKPLVWGEDRDADSEDFGAFVARSPTVHLRYIVRKVYGGGWKLTGSVPFGQPTIDTLEAAKAAAQADYEARILSVLDMQPTMKPLRYIEPEGETLEQMRDHARQHPLAQSGDMRLVWVNEGDLHMQTIFHAAQPTVSPELLATTNDVAALMEAAEKVISSYWHSTDGVITGIYDLETALARVKGET